VLADLDLGQEVFMGTENRKKYRLEAYQSIPAMALEQLAREISADWSIANGAPKAQASLLLGEYEFAIYITEALTEGEKLLAIHRSGEPQLRQYIRGLLDLVCQEKKSRIISHWVEVNFELNWALCYFKLAKNQSQPGKENSPFKAT
jgi:hypothetical protein